MINRDYFKEIGLETHADEFDDDELVETVITVRLPKRIFEKTANAAEWRRMPLEKSIERDLFVLATSQADSFARCLEDWRAEEQIASHNKV